MSGPRSGGAAGPPGGADRGPAPPRPRRLPGCVLRAVFLAVGVASVPAVSSQTPPAAARMCLTCHGANGISVTPDAPHLAGQPAIYLEAQLKAYRSGARRHEVMQVIAKPLSDDDIAQAAAWFAAIKIEAKLP
jgi:cytochrome c553